MGTLNIYLVPYYIKDPTRDPNFDNYPYIVLVGHRGTGASVLRSRFWGSLQHIRKHTHTYTLIRYYIYVYIYIHIIYRGSERESTR